MRTFVGIALDESHADALVLAAEAIREASTEWRQSRWVPPENLHVTLRFIGNVPDESVEGIAESLENTLRSRTVTELAFDSISAVPGPHNARMVWAAFTDRNGQISELANAVDMALVPHGIPIDERRFTPHVTLARSKRRKPIGATVLESATTLTRSALGQNRVMSVGEATLYKSTLSSAGATYEILARIPLEGSR